MKKHPASSPRAFFWSHPLFPHWKMKEKGEPVGLRLTPDYTRANFSSLTSLHTCFAPAVSTFSRSALGALQPFLGMLTPFGWRESRIHIVRPLESACSTSGHLDYVGRCDSDYAKGSPEFMQTPKGWQKKTTNGK